MIAKITDYKLTIRIDLINFFYGTWVLLIYSIIVGLLLGKKFYYPNQEIEIFVYQYIASFGKIYYYFKQYLLAHEVYRAILELRFINSEILSTQFEIVKVKEEIEVLKESKANLTKLILKDTTELDAQLKIRTDKMIEDWERGERRFWQIVFGSLVYEVIILWIFW